MSSDEEDYMSEAFLKQSEDVCPGLPKRKTSQREHELYKKKLKCAPVSAKLKEQTLREEGLNKAISSDNKGFAMLAKMGYKPGTSLGKTNEGIKEPINIELRDKKLGVGAQKPKTKKYPLDKKGPDIIKMESDFKKNLHERKNEKVIKRYFYKAQSSCEHLDDTNGVKEPVEDFYWPRSIVDKLRGVKRKSEDDEDYDREEAENEEIEYESLISLENLNKIVDYVRQKYLYCIFCAAHASDPEDFENFCPGAYLEDHDLD